MYIVVGITITCNETSKHVFINDVEKYPSSGLQYRSAVRSWSVSIVVQKYILNYKIFFLLNIQPILLIFAKTSFVPDTPASPEGVQRTLIFDNFVNEDSESKDLDPENPYPSEGEGNEGYESSEDSYIGPPPVLPGNQGCADCTQATHYHGSSTLPHSIFLVPGEIQQNGCCGQNECKALPLNPVNDHLTPLLFANPLGPGTPHRERRYWVYKRWWIVSGNLGIRTQRVIQGVNGLQGQFSCCVLRRVRSTLPSYVYSGSR